MMTIYHNFYWLFRYDFIAIMIDLRFIVQGHKCEANRKLSRDELYWKKQLTSYPQGRHAGCTGPLHTWKKKHNNSISTKGNRFFVILTHHGIFKSKNKTPAALKKVFHTLIVVGCIILLKLGLPTLIPI